VSEEKARHHPAAAVVPAAGRGERFGGAKLLADVDGQPLLDRTIGSLLDGGAAYVIVVQAAGADLSAARMLADERVGVVINPDASRGMFSSIQIGIAAVGAADPVLVLPGDMPFVHAGTIALVADECLRTTQIVVPTHDGRRGHPVAIPGRLRSALLAADPLTTLKIALAATGAEQREIAVDDPGVLRDVDVRADLS
jgi:molybdenum cofactor cytidylyltransferase